MNDDNNQDAKTNNSKINETQINELNLIESSGEDYIFEENDFTLVHDAKIHIDKVPETPLVGFFADAFIRFAKNKASLISLGIIGIIVLFAIIGPSLSKHTYKEQNRTWDNLPPKVKVLEKIPFFSGAKIIDVQVSNIETTYKDYLIEVVEEYEVIANKKPVAMAKIRIDMYAYKGADGEYFWMGTDSLGRDSWTRLWRGARVSLLMSLMAVVLNLFIGVLYGSISAYYGGKVDLVMQRISEILGSIPTIPLLILFIVHFGAGLVPIVLSLCITGWIGMSNMIRAQFYKYKGYEYVMASRTMGANDRRIIFRHILPNAFGPTITQVTMAIPRFIMTESTLAYLGLGIQAPEPSIGVLLAEGQSVLFSSPHLTVFPALIISLLMLSFNLVNNGLRDSFDPSMRGQ